MSDAGGSHTAVGNRYGDLNQDNSLVINSKEPSGYGCWAVFDGHGVLGEHASRIASSTFQLLLAETDAADVDTLKSEFDSAFVWAHQNICSSYIVAPKNYEYGKYGSFTLRLKEESAEYVNDVDQSAWPVEYGTTAVVAARFNQNLVVAWCGDSEAIVGGACSPENPDIPFVTALTPKYKHTLKNPDEKARVESMVDGIEVSIDGDCIRLGDTVVNMTRALGHTLICCNPDITVVPLTDNHQVLILATDGVWDHITYEDALEIALDNEDPAIAAREIVEAALGLNKDPKDQDNATAVVVFLDLE